MSHASSAPPGVSAEANLGDALRRAMRHVASPVTVVTTRAGGLARGATIGSFTSVSLDPPLVSFNVIHGTGLHGVLTKAEAFCVHLLHAEQVDLATRFAMPDLTSAEQLDGLDVQYNAAGVPVIAGTMGVLHCRLWVRHVAGDHDLVLGQVEHIEGGVGEEPLLYYARSYRTVGPAL